MPKRVQIGEVFEIPTACGLAYAQYTHQCKPFGGLIRVFDPLFSKRPSVFFDLVQQEPRFSTFFPVVAAINRSIFEVVGDAPIAKHNQLFPTFRNGVTDPITKRVAVWWFWDGEKEWKVGDITPEQRKMPLLAVWNASMLVKKIETGWTPSSDQR